MAEVKKFIPGFLLFCLMTVMAYAGLLYIMTSVSVGGNKIVYRAVQGMVWKGGYSYLRFLNYDRNNYYDVLVFGSSRANRGLDPHVFERAGYSMYNLGTDDQTPLNTKVLVKEYVKKNTCGLVILDLFDKVFSARPLESTSDLIQNLKDDGVAWKMVMESNDIRALNQFGIRTMLKNKGPEYDAETELYKGFRKSDTQFRFVAEGYLYKRNTLQLKALEETLSYLKDSGVPCLALCQPLPKVPSNQHLFLEDIRPILDKYGVTLYDFTQQQHLTSVDYFSDMCHLNGTGAEQYSSFVVDSLIRTYLHPAGALAAHNNSKSSICY